MDHVSIQALLLGAKLVMRRAMLHFLCLALAGIFLFGHPAFRLIRNLREIDRLCHANDGDVALLASSIRTVGDRIFGNHFQAFI
jgi:hypothetical protein